MSGVGIKELKNRLTQYLRRVKQGEEVIVTERGKPIALIQPIQSAQQPVSLQARLARLAGPHVEGPRPPMSGSQLPLFQPWDFS